ncbi:MAG: hypothetical protein A2651_04175 [Candidatus Yanofskybacteria bacterium RIFCSPHIGHO2_01_FULL_42_12]|uniref:HTH cro/C1-type domain-containing protein n=1 Tax=Candidatus Yanofskybacteria bacterium RIFCSPLOWO2_01_FULL_42_49 TaxID=1802694 RepID=A0A1F8GB43_9BACT|nr:MAG: hypothetical protein A2651_04175 [Candidatus Yanofskybacteria bacterium RIFCSPHIGHO2_01_FULL_42_12]OGN22587.1 MAG: hypothetical protein A2918_02395 [Candidatus Yanofskybacteria bacterium RIFCSPLOWO2_01_FULL_42_49]
MARPIVVALLGVLLEMGVSSESDEHFQTIISGFIQAKIMSEAQLADYLLVSRPSVNRWSRGRDLPRKNVRRGIYKALLKKIDDM